MIVNACVAICRLQALVDAGPTPPPGETGAKFIIRKDGRRTNLAFIRNDTSRALEVRAAQNIILSMRELARDV